MRMQRRRGQRTGPGSGSGSSRRCICCIRGVQRPASPLGGLLRVRAARMAAAKACKVLRRQSRGAQSTRSGRGRSAGRRCGLLSRCVDVWLAVSASSCGFDLRGLRGVSALAAAPRFARALRVRLRHCQRGGAIDRMLGLDGHRLPLARILVHCGGRRSHGARRRVARRGDGELRAAVCTHFGESVVRCLLSRS